MCVRCRTNGSRLSYERGNRRETDLERCLKRTLVTKQGLPTYRLVCPLRSVLVHVTILLDGFLLKHGLNCVHIAKIIYTYMYMYMDTCKL